ncbi:MAG: UDP-N-acetylglucosamine 4,6-dehydratase (inverting) [Deltaproteobacteria bacterium]|nr:UDP-N-acetylglucosamine 4,6-dehydratase (inverting) [Deltaproteobacteria bacterium]
MFDGSSVAITGGTGMFGHNFLRTMLSMYRVRKLIVFSRDELKQYEMANMFSPKRHPEIRYFLGDVRDEQRLREAFWDVDYVIHAATVRQISAMEYNPFEAIKTNVLGAQNVISASIACGVKKVIALSTEKAASPSDLYGATKLCSDKLFVAANSMSGANGPRFSVVRYGSVFGSRESIVPALMEQKQRGTLALADKRMTRFSISIDGSVEFVIKSIDTMNGGEIFVPKTPSFRITDLATAIAPEASVDFIGFGPGERLHEVIIPSDESWHTLDMRDHFQIIPNEQWAECEKKSERTCSICPSGFQYSSDSNPLFLSVDQLKELVHSGFHRHV